MTIALLVAGIVVNVAWAATALPRPRSRGDRLLLAVGVLFAAMQSAWLAGFLLLDASWSTPVDIASTAWHAVIAPGLVALAVLRAPRAGVVGGTIAGSMLPGIVTVSLIAAGAPMLAGFISTGAITVAMGVVCFIIERRAHGAPGPEPFGGVAAGAAAGAAIPLAASFSSVAPLGSTLLQSGLAAALFLLIAIARPFPLGTLRRLGRGWGVLGDLAAGGVALVLFILCMTALGAIGVR